MKYTKDNPLKVVTLCSGYDSQCLALERLKRDNPQFDYELIAWSEIDKYAIKAHNALFPQWDDRNLGDMTKIDWSNVEDFDMLFYSTPCFVAGTMVITNKGEKPIEDIKSGDLVLTHTGNYRKVVKPMVKKFYGNLFRIGVNGRDIRCTPEHPFYVYNHEENKFEWEYASELGAGWDIALAKFDEDNNPLTAPCEYTMTLMMQEDYVLVYNMEVEEDHSYTANGVIVHNCQSISQAGLQHGFTEGSGTRSSIIWNVRDAIIAKKPKYMCLENVAAMVSSKFLPMFNMWQTELERNGYVNFPQVLNAKDYGVPQNRERIFLWSVRDDGDNPKYYFPKPFKLEKRLKDVLEPKVDKRYYLSDDTVQKFIEHCDRKQLEGCGFKFEPTDGEGHAKAITSRNGSRETDNFLYDE